ncbi:helix-turn-helix domain-containing protein [Lysinibacillus pakistanensis]|uniref:helix-turn-helix domain-containing protein n=1 Tax=Lysinibacillus pakistanensis TaxID=759811 RepID=UPI003D29E394
MTNVSEKEVITLSVSEVSRLLGVSTATIYTMVRNKQIPFFKMRGKILFNRGVIEAWTRGELQQV